MELRKESFFQKTWRLMCKYWQVYVLMLPGILFFLVIKVFPVWGLSIAFVDFKIKKGILGSAFVGLKWFDKFLSGPQFWKYIPKYDGHQPDGSADRVSGADSALSGL